MTLQKLSVLLVVTLSCALAEPPAKSGIEPDRIDPKCKPCDDFWRFANGGWVDKNPIPASKSSWGTMSVIAEGNKERLRTILEAAVSSKAPAGSNERKIGDLYSSCMNTAGIEAIGVRPIQPQLDQIRKISTREELKAALLSFQKEGRGASPVFLGGQPDRKNSAEIIASVGVRVQSLPEREFYFNTDARSQKIRQEFTLHVDRLLKLAGIDAAGSGKVILDFEAEFAQRTMTRVERRDPYASYNKMDLAGVQKLSPGFDWKGAMESLDVALTTPVMVSEPKVLQFFNEQLAGAPLETWKIWLQWRTVNGSAALLSKKFEEEEFAFNSTLLNGIKEPLPRWQKCTDLVDRSLGDALGEVFVKKHFPAEAKRRMNELVENLRVTLREELQNSSWMDPATSKNAVAKLNAFESKIGYPKLWRDYSKVVIKRDALVENVRSAGQVQRAYMLSKIGKPADNNDWGMTPPTVNAYYNPSKNEIAFPAGILQPPMFDMEADDAVNYGAIGAVIGHEMGHGFDDQGSKFDFAGNLKNWWTGEDRKKFDARAQCVIDEFNTLDVGDGLRHNGKLVIGEALGDLGGVTLAYRAYKRSLIGKPEPPVIDGFTADQRFFLAFARVWGTVLRPEATRMRIATDPHPISKFRANGTLMNVPEFHKAFQCKLGDAMVRPVEQQCKLW